jgi:hypothetical protein
VSTLDVVPQLRREFVRLKHKAWFFGGAALGLATPVGIRVYERLLTIGEVRPVVRWLFWPTSLLMDFGPWTALRWEAPFFWLLILGNALLYGLLAALLRRASISVAVLLVVASWIVLPPSDASLLKRFGKHRAELEQLVQMANHDAQFTLIGPGVIKTVEGEEYRVHEAQSMMSASRWAEYQRLFKTVGMNEGLNRNEKTGDVFVAAHSLGKTEGVATYFGYLYCADVNERLYSFPPCMERSDSADKRRYRWRKIDSAWYIYEVRVHGTDD